MNTPERRDRGLAYTADREVIEEIRACQRKLNAFNDADRWDPAGTGELLKAVIPDSRTAVIIPPFYCEYGTHIHLGDNFFAHYDCVLIDVASITIGKNCQMAPRVALYTAGHPVHPETRASGYEYGKPIVIGDDVWLGGGTVVLPGVTIGDGAVIGAGSVVTKDIPPMTVAAGNPCRVIREITEADRRKLFRREDIDDEIWQIITGE